MHVMEHHYDFDLTYITERIISVFFLPDLEEQQYRRNLQEVASMLKSKHQDKFLVLSSIKPPVFETSSSVVQVQDYGWPDLHAPPLDRICAVCKAMETWLTCDPTNVVVLHCKGNKGKTGVIVAAYMHYSKISAGADQALTTLAMRKFCEDKVSSSLQPSQKRYIYYFGGLLSGTIKMNSNPLFLHQILIPSLPNFQAGGGFYPFLKIYQSLQLVYTSGVYCISMHPVLSFTFSVQFNTFIILFYRMKIFDPKLYLNMFQMKCCIQDQEYHKNDASIKVDYNTLDPVVRWDSYENFNLHHEDIFLDGCSVNCNFPIVGSIKYQ
uniref:Phosphatase tensin-type domain-containing protein n=1 Tax=Amphilophus citrinellus TaxID=61819 RepID=A0A3Q0SB81_AMPCI